MRRFCLDFSSTLLVAFGLLIALNSQVLAQRPKPIPVGLCTSVGCRFSGPDGGCIAGCTANGPDTCTCTTPPILINGVPCFCEVS